MNTKFYKKFRNIFLALMLGVLVFNSACVVSFDNPLTTSNAIDTNLLGVWKDKEDDINNFRFFKNAAGKTQIEITDNTDSVRLLTVSSIKLGKFNYLSLHITDIDEEKDIFFIARYEIKDNRLNIWLPNRAKFLDLIEKNKLKGKPETNQEVNIQSSSAELVKFFETVEDESFFEPFGEFIKQ